MRAWRTRLPSLLWLAWIAASGACLAQALPDVKRIIADQLLYPRDARYTLPSTLPAENADAARNAEWMKAAQALEKAGLVRITRSGGQIVVDGTEQSLDVVVPSMNLRYETTALNVVLGRWDIDVAKAASKGAATVVEGRRRLVKPTRAHKVLAEALPPKEAARLFDQDAVWEVRRNGASYDVVEKLK